MNSHKIITPAFWYLVLGEKTQYGRVPKSRGKDRNSLALERRGMLWRKKKHG